jgi:hypothetical protein
MIETHAFTYNGRISMPLTDSRMPIPDVIAGSLAELDGGTTFAYSLFKLPDGKRLSAVDPSTIGTYLQGAGTANRMTIEMRDNFNGTAHHYTVGRSDDPRDGERAEHVNFLGDSVIVFPNEVFDLTEAVPIFRYYYDHGTVPPSYELRPL